MLRYIYADELNRFPELANSMFRDRADQFKTRLGWEVSVDENGEERDQYDDLNPLYVIWEEADGRHGGSMRFLPTTGPVMVNEVFGHLTGGAPICSPLIWECTRFCLARDASPNVAAALMLGGGEIMTGFGIRHFAGVFDARMVRIYKAIGSSPEVLGSEGTGRDRISVGLWEFTPEARERVAKRAGIPPELSRLWFSSAFGTVKTTRFAKAG
ncbi:Acyl-homoserine-lactone synthase [Falsiruegeria litorea R37]|uniref:Acyl-homoserine-lactone synthase n=1 Tax=Falsiruegeria litorea R37 TaxID=1200284 RepID=A0A1Y5TL52_9RHOB|nr:acyl-homoserine-lactone synthase [Falsiruegeria litorea]SLN66508.1 Acyl-homoserine-lactone synthase [Falsiruegeria litorea R37]